MKEYDFKGIITAIKEASPSHLALVALLVFPIILKFWIDSIMELFPDITNCWRIILVILILFLFLSCIIWIAVENKRKNELRVIRDKIMTRLLANNWNSMSFDSAKKVLGADFPDDKIVATIEEFSRTLRHVRLKDKDKNGKQRKDTSGNLLFKPGVGRINQIDE